MVFLADDFVCFRFRRAVLGLTVDTHSALRAGGPRTPRSGTLRAKCLARRWIHVQRQFSAIFGRFFSYFLREGVDSDPEVAAVLLHATDGPLVSGSHLVSVCLARGIQEFGFGRWLRFYRRWFAGRVAPRAVFPDSGMCKAGFAFALCSLWLSLQDARHLGRYGPEGQLCARRCFSSGLCLAGVAGVCTSYFVPFFRRQAKDALHHGRFGPHEQ